MHLHKNASRLLALLLALPLLLCSLPVTAEAADKHTPETLFDGWMDLEEKWSENLRNFDSGGDDNVDALLEVVLSMEELLSLYRLVEMAIVSDCYDFAAAKKNGSYDYDRGLEETTIRIAKKTGRYQIRVENGENKWKFL